MIKRFFAICAALLLAAAPQTVAAFGESGLAYRAADGEITVYGYDGTVRSLVIPDEIDGLPVTSIEDLAFWGCRQLTDVLLPSGIRRIGEGAFCECTSLRWAVLPPELSEISDGTFQSCTGMEWFVVPRGTMRIGEYAFNHCSSLTEMQIPGTVREIGSFAFNSCTSLRSVHIAEGTRRIGACAFAGCAALALAALPESLEFLGEDVFRAGSPHIDFAGTRASWEELTAGRSDLSRLSVSCRDDIGPLFWAAPDAGFEISGGLVRGIAIGRPGSYTSLGDLALGLRAEPGCRVEIHVPLTSPAEAEAPVTTGTGIRAVAADGAISAATVIIMGDVCETGILSIAQVVRLAGMLGESGSGQAELLAGDWNGNGRIDIGDLKTEAELLTSKKAAG